jgi:hypothetical protein
MSEIYPGVRTSIRNSVLQVLYTRPGAWLSTHDLLALVEEAETSDVLARVLSDMAATGRLAKGAKTRNARGQECNTWGLSPEWRARLTVENTLQAIVTPHEDDVKTAKNWILANGAKATPAQDEPPPLPAESIEDEAPAAPAPVSYTLPADKVASTNTPASPRCTGDPWDGYAPLGWTLAQPDQMPETPPANQATATDIHLIPLPERWLPELRLRLQAIDGAADPEITLRINTEGGAYLTLSTRGEIACDPGELDFLPSIGTALCQFVDALYPYGVKPGAK